jgi:hypothetical protein
MDVAPPTPAIRAFELSCVDWCSYFADIDVDLAGVLARVTMASGRPDQDDRVKGWPLRAILYDSTADEIEIHVGLSVPRGSVLRYFVAAPRAIQVKEWDHRKVIAVDDARGTRTLIHVSRARADAVVGDYGPRQGAAADKRASAWPGMRPGFSALCGNVRRDPLQRRGPSM